jgi:SAM-dependent methyltransferase
MHALYNERRMAARDLGNRGHSVRGNCMVRKGIETLTKNGICYLSVNGKARRYTPWLGDLFSFFYDSIMEKSVFPKKLGASFDKHMDFIRTVLSEVHNASVLEIGTGSGSLSELLPPDNRYTGSDISEGLLRIGLKKFVRKGFADISMVLCGAEDLLFEENSFDLCVCNLTLNFIGDIERAVAQIRSVLKSGGVFLCSVPVPERNTKKSIIRGRLLTEKELKSLFESAGFRFTSFKVSNGAILYFKGELKQ